MATRALSRSTGSAPVWKPAAPGTGTVSGSTLNWTAEGTATRGGLTCPFTFGEGTARPEGSGVRVTFAGTLCGLPVSGTELLQRK